MFTTHTLRDILQRNDLAQWADLLLAESRPAVQITTQPLLDDRLIPVGASKFGGSPDVPSGFMWPEWNGKPLTFLAQFRLSDVAQYDPEHALPSSGMLYFFYEIDEQPWGYDPAHEGGAVVLFHPDEMDTFYRYLHPRAAGDLLDIEPLPASTAHFSSQLMLPATERALNSLATQLSETEYERYDDDVLGEIISDRPDVWHHMLGYPDEIQNDMQLECQLVTNGLYVGDSSGYRDRRRRLLETGAADWRLLLQLDTDENIGVEWGDSGRLYFWIRNADLQACDFSQCWTILQCF